MVQETPPPIKESGNNGLESVKTTQREWILRLCWVVSCVLELNDYWGTEGRWTSHMMGFTWEAVKGKEAYFSWKCGGSYDHAG